ADFGNARDSGVAREVGVDGLNGRVLDVTRRGEVRLARAEVDEFCALGAEAGGLGGYGNGCGDFNASNAFGKSAGACGSRCCHGASIFSDFRRKMLMISIICELRADARLKWPDFGLRAHSILYQASTLVCEEDFFCANIQKCRQLRPSPP